MEHTEFVDAYKNRTRNIYIDRSKALQAVTNGFLPKRYQFAHIFWSWVWFLSILAGIAILIFQKWWAGLIFLVFVPSTISAAVKKSTFDFVIQHAIEDPKFYTFAISNDIITIE